MNPYVNRSLVAVGVAVLVVGTMATYEKYRGTDLSRVPALPRAVAAQASGNQTLAAQPGPASSDGALASVEAPGRSTNGYGRAPLAEPRVGELMIYPEIKKGMRTPFDLWRYYGRGESSYDAPVLPMRFEQWRAFHGKQRPQLMKDVKEYMDSRYDFSGAELPGQYMSGGKPIMKGPVARLLRGVQSFEDLAMLPPAEIKRRDLYPYKPLSHPLQSTGHMVFPRCS
jgi:hypothetical protein